MSSTSSRGDIVTTSTSPQHFYKELSDFINAHTGHVLQIEVLPSSFPLPSGATSPILHDGPNLGVPKKALVQAFLIARHTLFSTLQLTTPTEREAEDAMTVTHVILLFDPEHLTAANYRKRRLLDLRATRSNTVPDMHIYIKNELVYLESLLTSPLHRHTKSPTLWHHRRWLVTEFLDQVCREYTLTGNDCSCSEEGFEPLWRAELGVVERSGDRHPKNYYAWSYARWLLGYLAEKNLSGQDNSARRFSPGGSAWRVYEWCLVHPTDISGWSFLIHLLRVMRQEPGLHKEIFEKVWEFTRKFSWEGEAVWWFLRTVLAMEGFMPVEVRNRYLQTIMEGLQGRSKTQALDFGTEERSTNPVVQAVHFCTKFGHFESPLIN